MSTRAIFLDRDGVINACPPERYLRRWSEFSFLPGSCEAIRALSRSAYRLLVISNQSGVGQGLVSRQALDEITRRMIAAIRAQGGRIDGVLYCPHRETDGCDCRKPRRGLIDQADRQHPLDLPHSVIIGDDPNDLALGRAVGCRTVLVLSGRTPPEVAARLAPPPDHLCRDLQAAARWILARADCP